MRLICAMYFKERYIPEILQNARFGMSNFDSPSLRGTASVSVAGRSNPQRYKR
jgi:hypothetical protein